VPGARQARQALKGAKPVPQLMPATPTSLASTLPPASAAWYAAWTHSHCEQIVRDQLVAKGYYAFLPTVDVWRRRRGVRKLNSVPMFPGYLFIRHAMDRRACTDVCGVRGLVRMLGAGWDRPAPIADDEMDAIERVTLARLPVLPFPYLTEGQRARIVAGPLSGVEGRLVEVRSKQGLLVLSVELLQRSVAVVVDATEVTPA
jgi:transcription antitermination factor NusG